MSDDDKEPVSAAQLAEAFTDNEAHALTFCCSATETLKDREDDWKQAVAEAFRGWLADKDSSVEWESCAAGWTAFAHDLDRMILVAVPCGCHPKAKCDKCGPVKGKVRGTVYLRRIDDDRYFLGDTTT
jgi:hypothetical protein